MSILRKQKLWCSTKWVDITYYPFCFVTELLIRVQNMITQERLVVHLSLQGNHCAKRPVKHTIHFLTI